MSQPDDQQRDELRDRLIDQALREVLGGEAPPELSDKILAAATEQGFVSPQPKEHVMDKSSRNYRRLVFRAVAACLLVGVTIALLLPATQKARESARRTAAEFESPAVRGPALHRMPQSGPPVGAALPESTLAAPAAEHAEAKYWFSVGKRGDLVSKPQRLDARVELQMAPSEFDDRSEFWGRSPTGQGPGKGGDKYDRLVENPFRTVKDHPLSTFSIDVDTASYANVRRFLLSEGSLPPPDAVRIEELINYFDYDYAGPEDDVPFAAHIEVAGCPWTADHRLVRVGLKGKEIAGEERPESNLVFLLDVSGSMDSPDKLPLLREGMKLLAVQMRENDRVAIVVYASAEGLVLPSTPGSEQKKIIDALDRLQAGGSTNGGAGIELAYRIAQENSIPGGVNRVLLCTDGDFNVGTTSTGSLERMVEEKARSGVFLSVLGFGRGNLNDAMMETISNKGNGNYAYIDGLTEAQKVLVEQMGGTLITIAKDVKIQVEFNPARVGAYRLIGYENRMLAAEDFNDDKKDAGEIGAGHTVTALYEIVPVGVEVDVPSVDPLKYQTAAPKAEERPTSDELLTLKLRYKDPEAEKSKRLEFPVVDSGGGFSRASGDFQFAAAVASFGMLLRDSQYKGTATYDAVLEIAASAKAADEQGYRSEFLEMVRRAKTLAER